MLSMQTDDKHELRKMNFSDGEFRKSTFTPAYPIPQYQCVMVAMKDGAVAVRDSKDRSKTTLIYSTDEWRAFIKGVKAGEFDA